MELLGYNMENLTADHSCECIRRVAGVSNLWQVGGFLLVLPVSSTNNTDPH
jgi:hypothetical protein